MKKLNHFCEWAFAYLCKTVRRRCLLILFAFGAFVALIRWRLMCVNMQPQMRIQTICSSYESGQAVGNLCMDLCRPDKVSSISCHAFYKEQDAVFTGMWKNNSVVFKSVKENPDHIKSEITEGAFSQMIKETIQIHFNISIDIVDAKRMSYVQTNQKGIVRYTEINNIWSLMQSNEYLVLLIYEKYDIFPKLYGSCGSTYAVQKLNSISGYWHLMAIYDSKEEWERRIKISLMILDYLLLLDERLPEPLHICDMKMNHFRITDDLKRVMYVDLDAVHPLSVANKKTADGSECRKHSDCDFLDCRSFCNLITFKCQHGVVNNNLQMVCERIFLGWVLSGRVMVPGLLLGPHTPRVLTELLEMCANPATDSGTPRACTKKDTRNRLYHLLSHLLTS